MQVPQILQMVILNKLQNIMHISTMFLCLFILFEVAMSDTNIDIGIEIWPSKNSLRTWKNFLKMNISVSDKYSYVIH